MWSRYSHPTGSLCKHGGGLGLTLGAACSSSLCRQHLAWESNPTAMAAFWCWRRIKKYQKGIVVHYCHPKCSCSTLHNEVKCISILSRSTPEATLCGQWCYCLWSVWQSLVYFPGKFWFTLTSNGSHSPTCDSLLNSAKPVHANIVRHWWLATKASNVLSSWAAISRDIRGDPHLLGEEGSLGDREMFTDFIGTGNILLASFGFPILAVTFLGPSFFHSIHFPLFSISLFSFWFMYKENKFQVFFFKIHEV